MISDPTPPQIEDWFKQAKAGSSAALGELLRYYGPRIERGIVIASKWNPVLTTADVMQITYLEAILEFPRFQGSCRSFPSWLNRMAQNNLADAIGHLSAQKRPQPERRDFHLSEDGVISFLYSRIVGSDRTPSTKTHFLEVKERLLQEIGRLPTTYAQVIRGTFFEGKTVVQVAAEMGKTEGATYLMKARALERLAVALGSQTDF